MIADSHPAILTSGLARNYGKTPALLPTSLTVPHGSIFALLGHNGAGKTTLIKLLVNILRPSAGGATVLGLSSSSIGGDDFLRIGYVSENQDLPGWMTVRSFLDFQSGFYPQWNVDPLIKRFNLPLSRKLKNLSRGQRMKAALASVLAFSPALIILDEPFSGLDPLVRDELIEALLDAAATQPTTILLSSHDLAEIESFATHVAFLHAGSLLFAEEMPQLSARFRDVSVTLASTDSLVQQELSVPPTWLNLQQSGHTFTFVHTQAGMESIEDQVRQVFPPIASLEIEPMNLRSIFLAIAKTGRRLEEDAANSEGGR